MLALARIAPLGACLTLLAACAAEREGAPRPDAAPPPDAGSAADAGHDAGAAVDAGPPDSGASPDAGLPAPPPSCEPTDVRSACGTPAVVRTVIRLGDGMPAATGVVQVRLNHLRLGNGDFGGVPHTAAQSVPGVELTASAWGQLDFDMCAGGEMWSEDNCEYNLFAFLDLNEDGELNRGEPAGRKTIDVSCFADPLPCHDLVLDCVDGASCIAFDAEPVCACAEPTCPEQLGKIVTCQ